MGEVSWQGAGRREWSRQGGVKQAVGSRAGKGAGSLQIRHKNQRFSRFKCSGGINHNVRG